MIYWWWLGIAVIYAHAHAAEEKTADHANSVVLALATMTTFSCEANATHSVGWHVIRNGEGVEGGASVLNGIDVGPEIHLGGILFQRNVTVTAREEHNHIILQCVAIFSNNTRESASEFHLWIQGLLPSPDNVTITNVSSSLLLSWTGPFTLNITDVDPDISHYTVYITNLNTSQNWSVNVTETEFIFTGLAEGTPDPCHTYQFTVSAWNVVGEGNRSEPVYGEFIPENRTHPTADHTEESPGTGGISVPTAEADGQFPVAAVILPISAVIIAVISFAGLYCYLRREDRRRRLLTCVCRRPEDGIDGGPNDNERGLTISAESTKEQSDDEELPKPPVFGKPTTQVDSAENCQYVGASSARRRANDLPSMHRSGEDILASTEVPSDAHSGLRTTLFYIPCGEGSSVPVTHESHLPLDEHVYSKEESGSRDGKESAIYRRTPSLPFIHRETVVLPPSRVASYPSMSVLQNSLLLSCEDN